ncbi:MAG: DNA replication/repair protein RecF [Flavobacteriales bacterium]|nr:DNA replication/repair protein RecF [Flavobacteriales bacterium]|tara:strand:- start:651 stop:1754 length:1104 start_codon:yes stop_codon:yes gene_type:complete
MYLKKLSILNFKNYEEASLDFSTEINCFLGQNGSGKTNLLDAIFYLAFCKSFFNPSDSQLIKDEESFFVVEGEFDRKGEAERIYCGLKKGQKKQFKRNKKQYERLADHIGLVPLVMISPSDSQLISEGSEVRRRFLDLIISQYDRQYLDELIQYNRALSQRNRLLKKFMEIRSFDEENLQLWDEQLIKHAKPIHEARMRFIESFLPLFQKNYDYISQQKEKVDLIYKSQLSEGDFADILKERREKDRRMTYSTAGVHKDDLEFGLAGKSLKKFGSQGQQKTFLLSLKLAQAEFLKEEKQIPPILLLDDIYDKLDESRVGKLMEIVQKDWFGQVFISDTHLDRLPKIFDELKTDYQAFEVDRGKVKHV